MDRNSESESITNEDSSDTNMGDKMTNHDEPAVKSAGKQNTSSLKSNGTQNGIDVSNSSSDISAVKQKLLTSNNTRKTFKKARHR